MKCSYKNPDAPDPWRRDRRWKDPPVHWRVFFLPFTARLGTAEFPLGDDAESPVDPLADDANRDRRFKNET
jgi:hypothetical protein